MPNTDFFDDDLVRQREKAGRIKMGPADEAVETLGDGHPDEVPLRPISELNLTRMARHRKEVDEQSAQAMQELERLKKRQDQLESEKRQLEDLRRKHEDYERGKCEMMDHLRRSLAVMERHEAEAQRMTALLGSTRERFKALLDDIESIKEETWPEESIRDELNKSLGIIENARMEYNKGMARVDAVRNAPADPAAPRSAVLFEEHAHEPAEERTFWYWLRVGLAVSLPLVLTVVLVLIVVMMARSYGML